jgi:hypothetical protein
MAVMAKTPSGISPLLPGLGQKTLMDAGNSARWLAARSLLLYYPVAWFRRASDWVRMREKRRFVLP